MSTLRKKPNLKLPMPSKDASISTEAPSDPSPASGTPYLVEVVPNLFLGDSPTASNRPVLLQQQIAVVVNLCSERCASHVTQGLQVHEFSIPDNGNYEIIQHFDATSDLIHQALQQGLRVLVHCKKGLSRAPTIVIAFLIKHYHMDYQEALGLVQSRRPDINPLLNYVLDLNNYSLRFKSLSA